MTYEMAEPLSAAKLESAMVDTVPQKLHDGAGVGRTSTKNPEEPLIKVSFHVVSAQGQRRPCFQRLDQRPRHLTGERALPDSKKPCCSTNKYKYIY